MLWPELCPALPTKTLITLLRLSFFRQSVRVRGYFSGQFQVCSHTHAFDQWFSTQGSLPISFGNICRHFWFSHLAGVGSIARRIEWVESRDIAKHPTMDRTASHSKKLGSPTVNSTEVEKPWSRLCLDVVPLSTLKSHPFINI